MTRSNILQLKLEILSSKMTKETLKEYTDKTRKIVKLILQTFLYNKMSGVRI